MAHDIVRLADEFFTGKAADLDESRIRIDDPALGIGTRNQVLILAQLGFYIMDG